MRSSSKIEACQTHLKREALAKVSRVQIQVAWGTWVSDKVMNAAADVRRAPESIRRPPGSDHTCNGKSKTMPR